VTAVSGAAEVDSRVRATRAAGMESPSLSVMKPEMEPDVAEVCGVGAEGSCAGEHSGVPATSSRGSTMDRRKNRGERFTGSHCNHADVGER
jgi:hypothetical protein